MPIIIQETRLLKSYDEMLPRADSALGGAVPSPAARQSKLRPSLAAMAARLATAVGRHGSSLSWRTCINRKDQFSMSRIRVITAHDPELLLRHAATGFLRARDATAEIPYPTVEYLLCVRQGALRDDVIRMAGDAGVRGWFDTPLCTFDELPERLGAVQPAGLSEYERRVIITEMLRTRRDGPFALGAHGAELVREIDTLFGELIREAVDVDALERATNKVGAMSQPAGRDSFEIRRDADFLALYRSYREALTRLARADGRGALSEVAWAIASGQVQIRDSLQGRRELRLYGLSDLRDGWRPMLAALAASRDLDDVLIYTSADLDFGGIEVQRERLKEASTVASRLFAEPCTGVRDDIGAVTHVIAPDVEREMDTVASRIRALIDDGTAPHRIAIVARSARPHVDQAIAALGKFGVPSTARQRVGLRDVPVVRALSALLSAAADGWTRYGLSHVARSPYIDCDVDPRVLDFIGFRHRVSGLTQWSEALEQLEELALAQPDAAMDETNARRVRFPDPVDVGRTRACFGRLASLLETLDTARPLADWLTWVDDFINGDAWGVATRLRRLTDDRYDIVRRDVAAAMMLTRIAREWRDALVTLGANDTSHDDDTLTASDFARALAPCLDVDIELWTETAHGVQVMEASAAAYRTFAHTFVVGMSAGAFPAPMSRSIIWDDGDREALRGAGLPLDGRDAWDLREQELFRVIMAGARDGVTLSHARLDATGRELIGSAFIEELSDVTPLATVDIPASQMAAPGMPLYRSLHAPATALHSARMERVRALRSTSAYNGAITHPDLLGWLAEEFGDERQWSPTQLEQFAKCPWAYLSGRLMRLDRLQDPDEEMDAAMRGNVLHDALALFYNAAAKRVAGPVFLLPDDWSWAEAMLESSLDSALEKQRHNWMGHAALRAAKRAQLQLTLSRFIRWEMDLHHEMTDPTTKKRNAPRMVRTGVVEHELSFEDMIFERDGVRIRYRGTIDRVEVSVDERLPNVRLIAAADYKSTKYSTPGKGDPKAWDDGVVLQVPLYAYALARLRPDHEVARVEYLALSRPESVHSLQLYEVDRKSSQMEQDDDAIAKWQSALGRAIGHVKQARRGEFPAQPPASCGCPPWCHGRDICRIPRATEAQ
jgi:RecB family exonuclease